MDEVIKEVQDEVLRCMMFVDYIVLAGENLEEVIKIGG